MSFAIFGLWRTWAVGVGILTVLTFLAPIVRYFWLLPLTVGCYIAINIMRRVLQGRKVPSCGRFNKEISVILFFCVLLALYLYIFIPHRNMHEITGQPLEFDTPFLAVLLIAPLTCIITLIFLFIGKNTEVCRNCRLRWGSVIEHGFVGDLYAREWKFQTRMLCILMAFLTVVDWGYFLTYYVNVNLNKQDYFYFLYLPLALYVLSLVYLGLRYYSLWVYYCYNDEGHLIENPGQTTLRYLVFRGDDLYMGMGHELVCPNAPEGKVKMMDTPFEYHDTYREYESQNRAEDIFTRHTSIPFGPNEARLKFIYQSPDTVTFRNIFHYFVFLPDNADLKKFKLPEGDWFSLGDVREMISMHMVAPSLLAELTRIYRVAMAFKTYDARGYRLYPIKHYRPTFRFRDIPTWDVDYSDPTWLDIYVNNQDRRFFWFHRLYRKFNPPLRILSNEQQ